MWAFLAILAAVVWGADYAIAEQVLKKISISTFLFVDLIVGILIAAVLLALNLVPALKRDLGVISSSPNIIWLLVICSGLFILGNILICLAIQNSNASWASLLEITYPLFVVLMTWLLFRQSHVTWSVTLGAFFIFTGVFIISYFNR